MRVYRYESTSARPWEEHRDKGDPSIPPWNVHMLRPTLNRLHDLSGGNIRGYDQQRTSKGSQWMFRLHRDSVDKAWLHLRYEDWMAAAFCHVSKAIEIDRLKRLRCGIGSADPIAAQCRDR